MRRRIIFTLLIVLYLNNSFCQNSIYHGKNCLILNRSILSYQKGDTIKTYDTHRNMFLNIVLLSTKYNKNVNVNLHYSDSSEIRTIDVNAVLKDSNILWNGKCVELDRSSKHSIVRFYTNNIFEGVTTYFVRDQVHSIESKNEGNITNVGLVHSSGKLSYYWIKDSLNRENGSSISFHENGEIKSFGHYKNGVRVGDWFYYDEKAKLVLKEFYKNGVLIRSKKKNKSKISVFPPHLPR